MTISSPSSEQPAVESVPLPLLALAHLLAPSHTTSGFSLKRLAVALADAERVLNEAGAGRWADEDVRDHGGVEILAERARASEDYLTLTAASEHPIVLDGLMIDAIDSGFYLGLSLAYRYFADRR